MYFLFQGAAPEKWMMEAGEYTMRRFAGLYGMTYIGMATDRSEAPVSYTHLDVYKRQVKMFLSRRNIYAL